MKKQFKLSAYGRIENVIRVVETFSDEDPGMLAFIRETMRETQKGILDDVSMRVAGFTDFGDAIGVKRVSFEDIDDIEGYSDDELFGVDARDDDVDADIDAEGENVSGEDTESDRSGGSSASMSVELGDEYADAVRLVLQGEDVEDVEQDTDDELAEMFAELTA